MSFTPNRTGNRDVDRNLDDIAKEFRALSTRTQALEGVDQTNDRDISSFRHTGATLEANYIAGTINCSALTTGAPTANVLRAFPLVAPRRGGTIDRIAINVTTAVAGNAIVGIYDSLDHPSKLYPGRLLEGSSSISTGSTGIKSLALSRSLTGGALYWLVHVGSAAPTLRCCPVGAMSPILGLGSALGTAPSVGISVAHTFAALPAIFPIGGAYITAVPIPAIAARFSA